MFQLTRGALIEITCGAVLFYKLVRDTVVGMGCKDSGSLLCEKHYVWSEGQRPTGSCYGAC